MPLNIQNTLVLIYNICYILYTYQKCLANQTESPIAAHAMQCAYGDSA